MIKGSPKAQRADGWSEAPTEVGQPLDEVRRQPKVVGAKLPVVFAFAQSRIGEGLAVGVDQLVFLQLLVQFERVKQHQWMFQPEWVIGNRLDFVRSFQDPAFTPGVDDAVLRGGLSDERQRNFENDGVNILARLAIYAAI